jgi:hypothetical protein
MPWIPHRFASLGAANADFCRQARRLKWQRRHSRTDYKTEQLIAMIEQRSLGRVGNCVKGFSIMEPTKTIASLTSVAAIACSIFAISWISLALLGF